ncbi:MAG: DUF167 domain-containing protein [Thermodesulfobacteriota bacterium]|nr:DUF167 domain-containing protein [Thermodesulfobacteriota bacterium]
MFAGFIFARVNRFKVLLYCREDGQGARFKVRLSPRASREGMGGLHGDALKVRVKAPPVDGRANEALVRFLAKVLGVRRSSLEIVSGRTGRTKVLRVAGLSPGQVTARLELG